MRRAKGAETLLCGHWAVVPCVSPVTVVCGEGGRVCNVMNISHKIHVCS